MTQFLQPIIKESNEIILERCIDKLEEIISKKNVEKPSLENFFNQIRNFEAMLMTEEEYKLFEEQKETFLRNFRQIIIDMRFNDK